MINNFFFALIGSRSAGNRLALEASNIAVHVLVFCVPTVTVSPHT